MSFNVLKKAPPGPSKQLSAPSANPKSPKSKPKVRAPIIRYPFSHGYSGPLSSSRDGGLGRGWERPRSPVVPFMRLSSPNTLFGRLLARLPIHVQLFINANVGLLLVASSQIFMVGMGLSAKYFVSTTEISTLTLIMVRMLITAACCIAWLAAEGKEEHIYLGPPEIRRLLVVRGITGFASLYAGFQSLRGLSVSDSTTIQFLAPNLTAALGFLVLGETLGWRDIVAGMTCLGGVLLISRPQFLFGVPAEVLEGAGGDAVNAAVSPEERALGVFWALIGVACSALSCSSGDSGWQAKLWYGSALYRMCILALLPQILQNIVIRRIGKRAHAMHSMLYFCYGSILPCFLGLLFHIRSFVFIHSWQEFKLIVLIGFFGFAGQILLTSGIQREKVGRATLATYLALLYSLILELWIFRTVPPFLSILGASIIIASAVWVVMHRDSGPGSGGSGSGTGSLSGDDEKAKSAKVYDEERMLSVSIGPSRGASPIDFENEYKAKRGELYQSYGRAGTLISPTGMYQQPQAKQWGGGKGDELWERSKERDREKDTGLLQSGWADKSEKSRRRNGNLSD